MSNFNESFNNASSSSEFNNNSNEFTMLFDKVQLKEQFFPSSKTRTKSSPEEKADVLSKLDLVKRKILESAKKYREFVNKNKKSTLTFRILMFALPALFVVLLGIGITNFMRTSSFNWYIVITALITLVLIGGIRFSQPFFVSNAKDVLSITYNQTVTHLDNLSYVIEYAESIGDYLTNDDVNALYLAYSKVIENTSNQERAMREMV